MPKQTLNVVNSNDLNLLSTICARIVQKPPRGAKVNNPFHFDKVIVMNKGMQTYLQEQISSNNKVCAGIDFSQVWAFIWELHKAINGADKYNRFSHEHITWSLFSMIDSWKDDVIYEPLNNYINLDSALDKAEKGYQLCGAIADAFDQYQMYRPDWIATWNSFTDDDFKAITKNEDTTDIGHGAIFNWITEEANRHCHQKGFVKKDIFELLVSNIWQIKLWCSLKGNLKSNTEDGNSISASLLDRASVLNLLIDKLTDDKVKIDKTKLPKRVFIFGVTAMPSKVIDLFTALGNHIPVFFMNLNPCREYWGDLTTSNQKWKTEKEQILKYLNSKLLESKKKAKEHSLKLDTDELNCSPLKDYEYQDEYLDHFDLEEKESVANEEGLDITEESGELVDGNPLLISLGKEGRDTLNELLSKDDLVDFINCFVKNVDTDEKSSQSVLNYLKDSLLTLNTCDENSKQKIKENDRSLQVRSCHTIEREVQVLRDEILTTIKYDKDINPKNMLVMVPNIEKYAPVIDAVFGSIDRESHEYIPYTICDKTVRDSSKIADAIIKLLSIGNEIITSKMVIDLLSVEAIAAKFRLTPDDISVIESWLQKANIYWGLDTHDVENQVGSPLDLPYTIERGLERLLKGFLLGPNSDTEAFEAFEINDYELLNKLVDFVDKLKSVRNAFDPNLDLDTNDWTLKLKTLLVEGFFKVDDDNQAEIDGIDRILEEMNEAVGNLKGNLSSDEAYESTTSIKIKLPVFKAKLVHAFGNDRDSSRYLRGGLMFCSLMPMRAIPFDHIYLLGLNDGDFPRKDTTPSFNLLGFKSLSRRNDRSVTFDDKFIFLEAIMSAKKSLYISYLGQSPTDKSEQNPSSVVTELFDYLYDNFRVSDEDVSEEDNAKAVKKRLFRQERLNAYDLENYVEHAEANTIYVEPSFNQSNHWVQSEDNPEILPLGLLGQESSDNPFNVVTTENISVSIDDLSNFILNNAKSFLRNNLSVRLNLKYQSNLVTVEPFELEYITGAIIQQDLIDTLVSHADEDFETCFNHFISLLEKKGALPTEVFKDVAVKNLHDSVGYIVEKLQNTHGDPQIRPYKVQLDKKDFNGVNVTFTGVLPKQSNVFVDVFHKDSSSNYQMAVRAFLHVLAYKFTDTAQEQEITVVSNDGSVLKIASNDFVESKEQAIELLTRLIRCYLVYKQIPLFFSKYMLKSLYDGLKPISRGANKRDWVSEVEDNEYLRFIWGENCFSELCGDDDAAYYLFGSDEYLFDDAGECELLSPLQYQTSNELIDIIAQNVLRPYTTLGRVE